MDFSYLRKETIGYGSVMHGPFGKRIVTYADYVASGKALRFIEKYCMELMETYANTHTLDNYTGLRTMALYNDAKKKIRNNLKANEHFLVLPTGSGTTAAIEKLSKILGIYRTPMAKDKQKIDPNRPVVFISSYEHHSNELMWREGNAEVVKIGLTDDGEFDLKDLIKQVSSVKYRDRLKIGSFSAASNVTGLLTPVYEISKVMHSNKGYVFFDYATAGPYVEINMTRDECSYFDGIFLSTHKFLGGPSASGLLVLNKNLYPKECAPTVSGGGTVTFVTNDDHRYIYDKETREDAGTPAIMQTIRAALALEVKDLVGPIEIEKKESKYIHKAMSELKTVPNIEILGNKDPSKRLAILSFVIKHDKGYLHHGFVARLLNDLFGIQSRAGCACAGPYGIELLDIDDGTVNKHKEVIQAGIDAMKPGWTRLNFHYTMQDEMVEFIIEAIKFVAYFGYNFLCLYELDCVTGQWKFRDQNEEESHKLSILTAINSKGLPSKLRLKQSKRHYISYIKKAHKLREKLDDDRFKPKLYGAQTMADIAWFYHAELKADS